ncbi:MAG: GTPase ObgE [Holosporales bacterium]|jgi:GTP-binding protein|nr:GTPase ObgE [Holosporales bacterium]
MRFLDEAKIYLKAGDGGNGCLSFRKEKFIEFGGPDGGAGGNGGSIYVTAVSAANTLIDYRYKQHFKAKKGENGAGQNKTGKSGDDIILKVPIGTQIFDEDKITEIADLTREGQIVLLAQGGRGGLGNAHFKSSTNRAPRKTQDGGVGEERWIWLKLKLIADVGLIGLPNAGKSTFISAVTNANAKTGNYPFSTLIPQLGTVRLEEHEFIIADIPGLIEDAHIGKGLGDKFLAHVERCTVLLHIIDISSENPVNDYLTIRHEIKRYGKMLDEKPEIIALNKADIVNEEFSKKIKEALKERTNNEIFVTSAISGNGCKELICKVADFIPKTTAW